MVTTIQINNNVKEFLDRMRLMNRESYNDVIEFMIEDNLELQEKVKEEIVEAIKRVDSGKMISHLDAKKRLGL
jgi:predicted transcriptional regulator